ncbi:hypothetical protein [Enterobacter sp.]|uniref:hypothetical protein n=1 Tax=Enterobacter sp. TaxID=42895 RepID=UPI0029815B30|nr:hypothetical protein [Enterobacter sp.]
MMKKTSVLKIPFIDSFFLSRLLSAILLFFLCAFSVYCKTEMFYYRIPFRIQTYIAITREEIKNAAKKSGVQQVLTENRRKILALLVLHKSSCNFFNDRGIRIYIYEGDREYFIDNKGVVLLSHNGVDKCSKYQINESEVVKLLNEGNMDYWAED